MNPTILVVIIIPGNNETDLRQSFQVLELVFSWALPEN